MHFINAHPLNSRTMTLTPIIATYALDTAHKDSPELDSLHLENDNTITPYSVIPWSDLAHITDEKLEKVQHWLETLKWLDSRTDMDYKTFMRYCTEFYVARNRLWDKDPAGQHKIMIAQEWRIFLLTTAHNDVGHHRIWGLYTKPRIPGGFLRNPQEWTRNESEIMKWRNCMNFVFSFPVHSHSIPIPFPVHSVGIH